MYKRQEWYLDEDVPQHWLAQDPALLLSIAMHSWLALGWRPTLSAGATGDGFWPGLWDAYRGEGSDDISWDHTTGHRMAILGGGMVQIMDTQALAPGLLDGSIMDQIDHVIVLSTAFAGVRP